uniref:Copia protein n=1 Tax=Cajanus cajan TaxID=3821 RepID=A0A151SZN2_CAJCA|nr:Copia protein [Cajanus cajan]
MHSGACSMVTRVLRAGYYWPTLKLDCQTYVQKCKECQQFSNTHRQPPEALYQMMSLWPFAQWGMDILGPFPLQRVNIFFEFHLALCLVKSKGTKEVILKRFLGSEGLSQFPSMLSSTSRHQSQNKQHTVNIATHHCISYATWHSRLGHHHNDALQFVFSICNFPIINKRHIVELGLSKYVCDLLNRTNMEESNPISFPMMSGCKLIHAHCDIDWASDPDDRRSTSGASIFIGPNLISWRSKKQIIITHSNIEAKYRSLALAIAKIMWIQTLLLEFHVRHFTLVIFYDNMSIVALAHNPILLARTKHMELYLFFVHEKVTAKFIQVVIVLALDQCANILTKALSPTHFC